MGKRSNFERRPHDFYETPKEAVIPLIPWLAAASSYYEPCCGRGALIGHLHDLDPSLICTGASDLERDARAEQYKDGGRLFITNPPWSRDVLHPIIKNLASQRPTWLLFDADWMHTKQAREYLPLCRIIQSVGRLKWIPDSSYTSKDNVCWYLFSEIVPQGFTTGEVLFYGRD